LFVSTLLLSNSTIMVPPPENDVESVIKAPPTVGAGMKHHDVWPGFGSAVDPSRVDRVQQALRTKVQYGIKREAIE
jgi:hypothetical protein